MKKHINPIDDFFRENLEDLRVTPSPEARKKFLEYAGAASGKKKSGLWLLMLLPLFLGVWGLVILYDRVDQIKPTSKENINSSGQTDQPKAEKIFSIYEYPVIQPTPRKKITLININDERNDGKQKINAEKQISNPEINIYSEEKITISEIQKPTPVQTELIDTAAVADVPEIPEVPEEVPSKDSLPANKSENHSYQISEKGFSAGLYYTPEWVYNLEDKNPAFFNNFGISLKYRYHIFSIGSGAGLTICKGANEYLIEKNKYEGTYLKLENMTFGYDPVTHQYIPNAVTVAEDVYDTAVTFTYTDIVKKYIYLQIPLILGCDFFNSKRFDAGISVGPILSVLLSESDPDITYDPGKDRIIRINDISPERINTNWQFACEPYLRWRFAERLSLETGPQVKYYFNSVFEKKNSSEKPWSVGVRTVIYFSW